MKIAVAKLAVVRAVAAAEARGLDSDLEFTGGRVRDGACFLIQKFSIKFLYARYALRPPRVVGSVGLKNKKGRRTSRKSLGPCRTDANTVEDLE